MTCGPGVQFSRRECSKPRPKNGGANCSGEMFRNRTCNSGPCVKCKILSLYSSEFPFQPPQYFT